MGSSYRMGRMGGKGEWGAGGIRSTFGLGARGEGGSYKEAGEQSEG